MARPKTTQQNDSIEHLLTSHIASLKNQIEELQGELKMAEQNKINYDKNKDVIESILSLKSAPDSSQPVRRTRQPKAKTEA